MNKFLDKEINKEINNNMINEINQNKFLESSLGKTINYGVDLALRAVLPDYLENDLINLKNNMLEYGFKDGIKKSINDSINKGKQIMGLMSGNIEDVGIIKDVIKSGGILDNISKLIDDVIKKLNSKNLINNKDMGIIKNGKNIIMDSIEKNLDDTLNNQVNDVNKLKQIINFWKESFNHRNFKMMEENYKKIENYIEKIIPIKNIYNEIGSIYNIHNLIKNNNQNFDLSKEQLELCCRLV